MTEIRTRHVRTLHDPRYGRMLIEHTCIDKPADLDTWIEHIPALAAEVGISSLEAHRILFDQFSELFKQGCA